MRIPRLVGMVLALTVLGVTGPARAKSQTPELAHEVVTLPPTIPLFPLQDVVLFPNISRPLHIFEPRYRAMVADVLNGDRFIGMILLRPGHESEYEGTPPVYSIGCAGVITEVEELPDGRYNIVLRGVVKFRVTKEDHTGPYRLASVEALPEVLTGEDRTSLREQRPRLGAMFASIAPTAQAPPPALPDEDLVNGLAQVAALTPLERQGLLERDGPFARAQTLIHLLNGAAGPR